MIFSNNKSNNNYTTSDNNATMSNDDAWLEKIDRLQQQHGGAGFSTTTTSLSRFIFGDGGGNGKTTTDGSLLHEDLTTVRSKHNHQHAIVILKSVSTGNRQETDSMEGVALFEIETGDRNLTTNNKLYTCDG